MFPYRVFVSWSALDEVFIARAPAFDTLAAHGDTMEEAVKEIEIAGKLMVESLKAHGRPVPESDIDAVDYSGKFALRMPKTLHARASAVSSAEGVSLNQLFVTWIAEGLSRTTVRAFLTDLQSGMILDAKPKKSGRTRPLPRPAKALAPTRMTDLDMLDMNVTRAGKVIRDGNRKSEGGRDTKTDSFALTSLDTRK
jgi:antitoxin HicB